MVTVLRVLLFLDCLPLSVDAIKVSDALRACAFREGHRRHIDPRCRDYPLSLLEAYGTLHVLSITVDQLLKTEATGTLKVVHE